MNWGGFGKDLLAGNEKILLFIGIRGIRFYTRNFDIIIFGTWIFRMEEIKKILG